MDLADGILTNALIQRGIAQEGNPVLMNIAGGTRFLIIKVLGILLAAFILWDIHRRHPRLAFWTSSAVLLIYAGIVAWNLHLLLSG